jgi:hypothetical protein
LARRGFAPAAERPAMAPQAFALYDALAAPARLHDPVLPALAGMELERQLARRHGQTLGTFCGGVLGFFGGFILSASVIFSRDARHDWFPFLFFGAALGGLVLGAVLGGVLGARLANWRFSAGRPYQPPARLPGWGPVVIAAGAFAGFFVGGVMGMAIVVSVPAFAPALFENAAWAIPILFFSPPVTGLVMGAYAGYRAALRWAARRRSLKSP